VKRSTFEAFQHWIVDQIQIELLRKYYDARKTKKAQCFKENIQWCQILLIGKVR
jgi:hypothetical protein